ncbi:hypothetical protein [Yinghuangia sp. ASG 101]|uniref:hypothetical protein n=1 Tax=Yinghuangia sp. ASG 101 TaxID=2896848 RepID=UPI003FCD02FB
MTERKKILLRLDPAVHDAVARWAADELRSTNSQVEFLLRRALAEAGRMPRDAGRPVRRGRPRKDDGDPGPGGAVDDGPAAEDDHGGHDGERAAGHGGADGERSGGGDVAGDAGGGGGRGARGPGDDGGLDAETA